MLRDSALFSVDHVSVVGLSRNALPAVSDELLAAARAQTTTDFSTAALRSSIARYTLIDELAVQTQFPHGVTLIEVSERRADRAPRRRRPAVPLAADGSVITGLRHSPRVATVRSAHLPVGGRSRDPFVLLALRVLIDAPAPLRHRVAAVTIADGALTIHLHRGPRLIFGNEALLHAKWDSAAAVLADASSRGASYIDLRLPSRPAAQVADPATSGSAASTASTSVGTPANAATVATALNPSLIQPSSST